METKTKECYPLLFSSFRTLVNYVVSVEFGTYFVIHMFKVFSFQKEIEEKPGMNWPLKQNGQDHLKCLQRFWKHFSLSQSECAPCVVFESGSLFPLRKNIWDAEIKVLNSIKLSVYKYMRRKPLRFLYPASLIRSHPTHAKNFARHCFKF